MAAFTNLKKICEEHLAGQYSIEVIDLLKNPQLAAVIRSWPCPRWSVNCRCRSGKIIGDLSDTERVLVGLDLQPVKKEP